MDKKSGDQQKTLYWALLCVGALGLGLPGLVHISQGETFFTLLWILTFLYLSIRYNSKRQLLISGGVFVAAYLLRYLGSIGFKWLYVPLFLFMGLIQFGIFLAYSILTRKSKSILSTFAFPILWMAVYLLATLIRIPSMIRVDMMFADMNTMLQVEHVLGSFGLSIILLWIFALLIYAIHKKRIYPIFIASVLFFAVLTIGIVYLSPNITEQKGVRVALSTGPYVGDYNNYTSLSMDRYLDSMHSCVAEAAEQGAEIIVFNEEAYEINDTDEADFCEECSRAARENNIHILLGLDLNDTDGSECGKSTNKVIWIDKKGNILGSYVKTNTIPLLESDYIRGDGVIPSHEIELNNGTTIKVSYVICYDSNFPFYINKIDDDTDILFLPSWDWPGVTEQHSLLCHTLAVENRVSIVKPTYDGISLAVRPDGIVIDSFDTNEFGYEQVRVVDIPLEFSKAATISNSRDGYVHSIIGVEIMSILICIALLYGNLFEDHKRTRRNVLFSFVIVTGLVALVADCLSWIFDGCARLESLLYGSTTISLLMTFVIYSIFLYYITEYARESHPVSTTLPRVAFVFCLTAAASIVVSSGSGLLFTFKDGVYSEGPLYTAYVVVNLLCAVFCLVATLVNTRFFGIHDRIATMTYVIFPLIAGCINLAVESFSYAYPAVVLSMVALYIMLQSEHQEKLENEGLISQYHAQHDALTGLYNRLAYEDKLQQIASSKGNSGAVFTDVNGLKYTNDQFGHEAGDRLLIRYAELLCSLFRKEDVFRISGDEFAILLHNTDRAVLKTRIKAFQEALNSEDIPLASVGYAFGSSHDIGSLIKTAESEMYNDKQKFYKDHPEMGRR